MYATLTTGAVIVREEAENGDVDQDLESARRLREPGVPRGPLGTPNCCSTIISFLLYRFKCSHFHLPYIL